MRSDDNRPTIDLAIKRLIEILRSESDELRALRKTLLTLLGVLKSPNSYNERKTNRPLSSVDDFVHKLFLTYQPVAKLFGRSESFALDKSLRLKRTLSDEGKFSLVWPTTFLPPPPTKEEYKLYPYAVCISFASEQRGVARDLAMILKKEHGLKVFYDDFAKLELWGKELFNHLYDIYSEKARFCVLLLSTEYFKKNWTNHELRAAQSRVLRERRDYVFPVMLEPDMPLPKPFDTFAYIRYSPRLMRKLCRELDRRFGEEIKANLLSEKELTEALNEEFLFQVTIDNFLGQAQQSTSEAESLRTLILGLIWAIGSDGVKPAVRALFEYVVFLLPAIADSFDADGRIVLFPPDGELHRSAGYAGGPLFMQEAFVIRTFNKLTANHPWFGQAKPTASGKLSNRRAQPAPQKRERRSNSR